MRNGRDSGDGPEDFALLGGLFGFINDEIEEARRKEKEEEELLDQETDEQDPGERPISSST